ncbi:MAG: 3-oxoacyl-ACP reductase FabG [Oligoflexia bacterium]|nr:3-oxoacyl-ACP reductase FabG [Oligoflexia bacterium]
MEKFQLDFSNQRVIVSGGTRGIGRGVVLAFLRAGATVVATWSSHPERAQQFAKEVEELAAAEKGAFDPSALDLRQCDVTKEAEVDALFAYLENKYPSIEILVNNAGIRRDALLAQMSLQNWNDVLTTNLTGTFNMSKRAVLAFLSNRYGRIINIGSIGGELGLPGQTNYAASKAGLRGFSRSLSKEVARKGITVNVVEPGFIDTELIADLDSAQKESYQKEIPLRRFGRVEEVAFGVLTLAHPLSAYVTGSFIRISGGL